MWLSNVFSNPEFWQYTIYPFLAGLFSLVLARFVSPKAAIACTTIVVGGRLLYWLIAGVPGLTTIGIAPLRAVAFFACLTFLGAAIASIAGVAIGAQRRITLPVGAALIVAVSIVGALAGFVSAFSIIDMVNASG